MKKIILTILLLSSGLYSAQMASLGLNINADDLEIEGKTTLGYGTSNVLLRNFYIDGNVLSSDESLVGIGLFAENSPVNYQNLSFNIGLRAIFSSFEEKDQEFTALPIFVAARARIYMGDMPPSHLGFKLAYAPTPLTFQDADAYLEYRIEFDMLIINNVNIYAGYRNIDTNYKDFDYIFNNSMYVGFKFVI